jgi:L,D-peptidoglycan transpeptidase YkuD (ErfK/YbiS/YcfS/YnhG family)
MAFNPMPDAPLENPPDNHNEPETRVLPQKKMPWKRRIRIAFALIIIAAVIWDFARHKLALVPRLPKLLAPAIPANCRQVVLVVSPESRSVPARMWMLERDSADGEWERFAGPIAVNLGSNGLAWGDGEHSMPAPSGFPIKQEGDGCSPAGVFKIPFAFGYAPASEAGAIRLPYVHVTETLSGIDDVNSKYYNQVVDAAVVTKDWESNETMLRPDGLYRWGAFIAHNPRCEPGRGSCIFFHLWSGPGKPTAGCTAMVESDVRALLGWLDSAKEPRLVQGLAGW